MMVRVRVRVRARDRGRESEGAGGRRGGARAEESHGQPGVAVGSSARCAPG